MGANYKAYNVNQSSLIAFNPKEVRANNPLVKAIDTFVEEHVSIEPFAAKVKNEESGATSVHPKMMLKVIFYSLTQQVYQSRKMENRLGWDHNYIYLSANQRVDHSTICNFLQKYKEEIMDIFSKMAYLLKKKGYVDYNFVATDGTKIKANAGDKFSGNAEDFRKKRKKIEKKIKKILNKVETEENIDKEEADKKLNRLIRDKEKIDKFLEEVERGEVKEEKKINLTDRDARFMKDKNRLIMGYNCNVSIDRKNHLIIGAGVFNDATDVGLMEPMVEQVKKNKGGDVKGVSWGFDSGYFSSDNLRYADKEGIDLYIPEGKEYKEEKDEGEEKKRICSKDCKLEKDGDIRRIICPGEQRMETTEAKERWGSEYYCFRPDRKLCDKCKLKGKCYKTEGSGKEFTVKKKYFETLELREELLKKISSSEGKEIMGKRKSTVEHIFGDIKDKLKFTNFLHRGLPNVELMWVIIAISYNLAKISKLGYG